MAKIINEAENADTTLVATRVEHKLEPKTALAREVMRQFRAAQLAKKAQRCGEFSLEELLKACYDARDARPSCDELALREKYPPWAAMPVSLVSFKTNILVSLVRETLTDVARAPFIVEPTPDPDLPEDEKRRIAQEVLQEVLAQAEAVAVEQQAFAAGAASAGSSLADALASPDLPTIDPDAILALMKTKKRELLDATKAHAAAQAKKLETALYDKTTEGGYRRAVLEFTDDFATYPFACMHGPFPTIREEAVWKTNKFASEKRVVWAFERVSPFDLYWTSDSTSTQDGTAVFIRKKVGYDYLYDCRRLAKDDPDSGYIRAALDELIEDTHEGYIPREWIDFFSQNPETRTPMLAWHRGESAEILIRYGRFSGYDLKEMGFADIEDDRLYETKIILCGGQVIFCQINNNPGQYRRPVFTASFESRNNSIVGCGLGQKLLPLERAYKACINLAMYNLSLSSEPVTEVEVTRILKYMPEEWTSNPVIAPGMVVTADGDRMGNGSRAIKFTQVPAITDAALRMATYIFEQAHVISNIPAALHGQPVGSGANRTVRGLLTLQGNTLKPIQSALMNLDLGVIEPMVSLLYMMLVMYDDDFTYSGDCKIVAKGAASMVEREMDKQEAMETVQVLGQLGDLVPPGVIKKATEKLLVALGVADAEQFAQSAQALPAIMPQGQPGVPGQTPADIASPASGPPAASAASAPQEQPAPVS